MPNLYAIAKKTWDATKGQGAPATGGTPWASGDIAVVFSPCTVEFIPSVLSLALSGARKTAPISGVATLSVPATIPATAGPSTVRLMRTHKTPPVVGTVPEPSNSQNTNNGADTWDTTFWRTASNSMAPGNEVAQLVVGAGHTGSSAKSGMISAGDSLWLTATPAGSMTGVASLDVGLFVAKPSAAPVAFRRSSGAWVSLPLASVSKTFALPAGGTSPDPLLWVAESTNLNEPKKWDTATSTWVSAGTKAHYYDGATWVAT